jgi:O-antigen/teichoic acid export membrane protein
MADGAPREKVPSGLGGFLRDFGVVALGNAGGKALMMASAPLLSRIFSPEDYGASGVVIAVVAVSSVIATLRYDMVLLTTRSRRGRANAVALTMALLSGYAAALALALAAGVSWGTATGSDSVLLHPLMLFAPAILVAMGIQSSIGHKLLVKAGAFRRAAGAGFAEGFGASVAQIGLGLAGLGPVGLLAGRLAGHLAALGVMLKGGWLVREIRELRPLMTRDGAARIARANYRQALFLTPANVLNTLASQLPVFLLAPAFGAAAAGAYYFINALAMAGMTFFIASAPALILREAARRRQAGLSPGAFILQITLLLLAPSLLLAAVLHIWSVEIVVLLFGDQWTLAGQILAYAAFSYAAVVSFVPSSTASQLVRSQHVNMLAQLARVIGTLAAIFIGARNGDILQAVVLIAISDCAIYAASSAYIIVKLGSVRR